MSLKLSMQCQIVCQLQWQLSALLKLPPSSVWYVPRLLVAECDSGQQLFETYIHLCRGGGGGHTNLGVQDPGF